MSRSRTPARLLKQLDERDSHKCVWYGYDTGRLVPQHRQGGMGGGKSKHRIENLLWLDSLMNGLIESDAELQAKAVRRGIKISKFSDPTTVPVQYPDGSWWLLSEDGTKERVEGGCDEPQGADMGLGYGGAH